MQHPGVFYLDPGCTREIEEYLRTRRWIRESEQIERVEPAGAGNMNCTVRVRTTARSFILKQSRPWVEKYPDISAPWDRALVEGNFYEWIAAHPDVARYVPRMLGMDSEARLLILEDLGTGGDLTYLYQGGTLDGPLLRQLLDFLSKLHRASERAATGDAFANLEMRTLNHEHIFSLPLRPDNGLDLDGITPGLQHSASALITDQQFRATVVELGRIYLDTGPSLLHGDYFPGSWFRTAGEIRIIDPEFCFFGPREFDAGCMIAHLHLATQPAHAVSASVTHFGNSGMNLKLMSQFAGVEIMRRLIGVAQLPVTYGLARKNALLNLSRQLVQDAPG